jgi:alpha-mannosidase
VPDVPGFGWRALDAKAGGLTTGEVVAGAEGRSLGNGLVEVSVDPADGTFAIDGHGGLGRLVDDGDIGDTYNWCPPDHDVVVERPEWVEVRLAEHGPVRGRLVVTTRFAVPERIEAQRRVGDGVLEVTTTIELRAGERFVRVQSELDNRVRDHRLRAWFPLVRPATTSRAECAFTVVERGLEAEGGPTELAMPTYPSRRFVQAGGVTVAHEGLLEYELVDVREGPHGRVANTLALTLLRCTGMLSQGPMATRPLPAGPMTPMEGPQVQGPVAVSFAVHVGDRDPYAIVDDAFLPLLVTQAGSGTGPPDGEALRVNGAEVSAVVRIGGAVHVRVFNPSAEPATVRLDGRRGWLVDLRGRPLEPFEGSFALRPWGIATAALASEG